MADRKTPDPSDHREITSSGGQFADPAIEPKPRRIDETERDEPQSGRKEGEDEWHNRANRSSEKGEGAVPMGGGNRPRLEERDVD